MRPDHGEPARTGGGPTQEPGDAVPPSTPDPAIEHFRAVEERFGTIDDQLASLHLELGRTGLGRLRRRGGWGPPSPPR